MSDVRESFPTLEDASTGEGKPLHSVQIGETTSSKNGSLALSATGLTGIATTIPVREIGDTPDFSVAVLPATDASGVLTHIPVKSSGAIPGEAVPVLAFIDSSTNLVHPQLTAAGEIPVSGTVTTSTPDITGPTIVFTTLDVGTISTTGANGQIFYSGTATAGSFASYALASIEAAIVQVLYSGATGTTVVEVSSDGGSRWIRPSVFQPGTTNYTNSFTDSFSVVINTAGQTHLRVRTIASWSGAAAAFITETVNTRPITIVDPLPNLNTTNLALETGGNLAAAAASLSVLDDWDESDRAKVNIIVGQAGVQAGAGAVSANTQRVVIATDQTVIPINDNGGSITVDGTVAVTQSTSPWVVSGTVAATQSGAWSVTANAGTNLNTSALALETTQTAQNTLIGAVTETAPATDTASSGLNGRLQRIAQRITSLIALLPTSLGQKTMANSFAVVLASDQSTLPVSVSGTVTSGPVRGTFTDRSGSATAVASSLMASNSSRNYMRIQNISGASIWINFTTTAVTDSPSFELKPDAIFELNGSFITTEAVSVIAGGGTRKYTAKEG